MASNDNPIIDNVFQKLLEAPHWKLNELSSALRYELANLQLQGTAEEQLFQHNFLLMNALFVLQDEVAAQGLYLKIESIEISLCKQNDTPTHCANTLKDYYLDWQNATLPHQAVCELLESFWQNFTNTNQVLTASQIELDAAFAVLELNKESTLSEVKHRWRKMALAHHPDRNQGDTKRFQELEAAYKLLTHYFKQC